MQKLTQWGPSLVLAVVTVALVATALAVPWERVEALPPRQLDADDVERLVQQGADELGLEVVAEVGEDMKGFTYQAGVVKSPEGSYLGVVIYYDFRSPDGVLAFAEGNNALATQLADSVDVSVMFRRPLTPEEFGELVQDTGIAVHSYVLRAVESSGQRATIFGAPDGDELVPAGMLDVVGADLAEKDTQTGMRGIITVEASASPSQLAMLLANERVFTTDVSKAVAAQRAQALLRGRGVEAAGLPVDAHMLPPLYWFLEDYGIAPK